MGVYYLDIHEIIGCVMCIEIQYTYDAFSDFDANENRAAWPTLQCYFSDQSSTDSIVSWNGILRYLNAINTTASPHNMLLQELMYAFVADNIGCRYHP